MNMEEFVQELDTYIIAHEPKSDDGESVLTLLYDAYGDMKSKTVRIPTLTTLLYADWLPQVTLEHTLNSRMGLDA